jgi:hypothetical protein
LGFAEDLTEAAVHGYRTRSFSVGRGNAWAFDCAEAVYRHGSTCTRSAVTTTACLMHRFAYRSRAQLLEIPVATTRLFPTNLPAGGGYCRGPA